MLSLINSERLAAGKPTLGWANPFVYHAALASTRRSAESESAAFHDVTQGSNPYGACQGFQAAPGWDPMTGLGSPNFTALVKLALA